MIGQNKSFLQFMSGSQHQFIIPVYQRKYNWKIENCKQLFDDLKKIIKENRQSHFFGSLVSKTDPYGSKNDILIIDGQQRITTVTLILLAMHHILTEDKKVSKNDNLAELIRETYLIDKWKSGVAPYKLLLIQDDRDSYARLFGDRSEHIVDSNLTINYNYFYERILQEDFTIDELYEALSRLIIIDITLHEKDNPQLIFESLNSTGLELSEGDKIRNYMLMDLDKPKQDFFYDKYWRKIEQCTEDGDVSNFSRDYLSLKKNSTPNINRVYQAFKGYVESEGLDREELLKDLLLYSRFHENLRVANTAVHQANQSIYRLNRLGTTVTRPFLMEVLRLFSDELLSERHLGEVFEIIESYIFRRIVCEIPANALNKIFTSLNREISRLDDQEASYLDRLKYVLLSKREGGRFPTDNEFRESLKTRNIYTLNSKNKMYLFERLENYGTKETNNIWELYDQGKLSIEHIMPQKLSRDWHNALEPSSDEIHETWLHRLANLTLTAYNAEYSNSTFAEKRDHENGYRNSGLRLNQWISQNSEWGIQQLKERSDNLASLGQKIWALPITNYQPKKKLFDSFSLDEGISPTHRSIQKFSFLGVEYLAKSWTDMYIKVISYLHEQDKSVILQIIGGDAHASDLSVHFVSQPHNENKTFAKIDDHVYLWVGISTQYKLNVLQKLFDQFNMNQNDLVFYLKPSKLRARKDSVRSNSITASRAEFWDYALPIIKKANRETGLYKKYEQHNKILITSSVGNNTYIECIVKESSACVRISFWSKAHINKAKFDTLYESKSSIEEEAGCTLDWERLDESLNSRISVYHLDSGFNNPANWESTASFLAKWSKKFYEIFVKRLK